MPLGLQADPLGWLAMKATTPCVAKGSTFTRCAMLLVTGRSKYQPMAEVGEVPMPVSSEVLALSALRVMGKLRLPGSGQRLP